MPDAPRVRIPHRVARLVLAGLAFALVAIAAEMLLRVLAPVPDPYESEKHPDQLNRYIRSEFPPDLALVTESREGLIGVAGRNHFTTNGHGFRGDPLVMPKPEGEYRVFLMGGSTMECLYLDDADSVDAVLQRALQQRVGAARTVKVFNTGKSGEKSDDHLAMYAQRVAHLEPDLVIAVLGFNDFRAGWWRYDYRHYGRGGPFANPPTLDVPLLLRMVLTEFQLPRYVQAALDRARGQSAEATLQAIPLATAYHDKVELRRALPVVDVPPEINPEAYRRNLEALVGMIRAQGTSVILGTQGASWNAEPGSPLHDWHWMQTGPEGRFAFRNDVLMEKLAIFNAITRDVAARQGVPLYDAASILEPTPDHYYDDVHWNVGGARRVALDLAALIDRQGLVPATPSGGRAEPGPS